MTSSSRQKTWLFLMARRAMRSFCIRIGQFCIRMTIRLVRVSRITIWSRARLPIKSLKFLERTLKRSLAYMLRIRMLIIIRELQLSFISEKRTERVRI